MKFAAYLAATFLATAGVAQAQTTAAPADALQPYRAAATVAADLSQRVSLVAPHVLADAMDNAAIPSRSVQSHIASNSSFVAALGFLCGREPGHGDSGAAAAYGYDPHGRFLGAKLSYGF